MELTSEQKQILTTCKNMQRNESLKIDACAGSGKTWILTQIAKAFPQEKFLYLAFNKAIVEDATAKFGSNVTVKTTHSLAYSRICDRRTKIVGKLNAFNLKTVLDLPVNELNRLLLVFNNYLNSDAEKPYQEIVPIIDAVHSGRLPMTHSFYLKEYQLLSTEDKGLDKYDWILLDEAQDTNAVTLAIFNDNNCKKIAVGDSQQSIYAFRGAINALLKINTTYNCKLSCSFRCEAKIISQVNWMLKQNSYQDSFPLTSEAQPHDDRAHAYISRTNSCLIGILASFDENTDLQRIRLLKDPDSLFKACLNIRKLDSRKKKKDFDPEYKYLENFSSLKELHDYLNDEDTNDSELQTAYNIFKTYERRLDELYDLATELYSHKTGDIYLCNAHVSKGLQFHEVTLLEDFPDLQELLKKCRESKLDEDELCQEFDLYYVALTRCKSVLHNKTRNYRKFLQDFPELDEGANDYSLNSSGESISSENESETDNHLKKIQFDNQVYLLEDDRHFHFLQKYLQKYGKKENAVMQ